METPLPSSSCLRGAKATALLLQPQLTPTSICPLGMSQPTPSVTAVPPACASSELQHPGQYFGLLSLVEGSRAKPHLAVLACSPHGLFSRRWEQGRETPSGLTAFPRLDGKQKGHLGMAETFSTKTLSDLQKHQRQIAGKQCSERAALRRSEPGGSPITARRRL